MKAAKDKTFLILILAPLIFMALCFMLPLGYMLALSFSKHVAAGPPVWAFTLENYIKFADIFYLKNVLWLTLKLGLLSTIATIVCGYPVAYFIAKTTPRLRSLLLTLIILPLWVNIVIRGFGFRILLSENGMINRFLEAMSLIQSPIRFMGTEFGVFLGLTQIAIPYVIIPLVNALQAIPPSMKEAAQSVGGNKLRIFWRITLPLSVPGLTAAAVLVFSLNVSGFSIPLMLGGGKIRMAAVLAYNQASVLGNFPFAATIGVILFIMTAASTTLFLRAMQKVYSKH